MSLSASMVVVRGGAGSLDQLDFQERRQLIASSLSLTDFLHCGAKEVAAVAAKKQNGSAVRTNSLGSGARTPPLERKSRLAALGRLFKPWKWKRKKKSDKFEAASRTLERKISVRANRDELVQKGILLPESPISTIPEPGEDLSPTYGASSPSPAPAPTAAQALQQQLQAHLQAQHARLQAAQNNNIIEPKKDKVDGGGGAACEAPRPERPSTLAPARLPRRLHYQTDSMEGGGGECERLVLSQLPEPPIALSEIGPIPPPPMFSSPSPVQRHAALHAQDLSDSDVDDDELDEQEGSCAGSPLPPQPDPCIDTSRVEEIPPKEPKFNAVPLKSALKKRTLQGAPSGGGSGPATPTQEGRPLGVRQDHLHASFNTRPVRIANTAENKENTRPWESDYRDDYQNDNDSMAAKLARKESLNIKLALRPDRQELINRNILVLQSDHERQESWEAIGARLVRRLSMRPTAEELVERNILKSQSPAEEKKQKEEKKRYLLRKLSFRPTVDELREKKIIRFSDYIEVTCAHDYDRRADKPWTRLTPRDKAAIRRELNEFKSSEMAVHEDSRHLTRFHRP